MTVTSIPAPGPAFFAACDMALGVVGSVAVSDGWELDSALEGFTVGGLAAHVYSALRTFERALDQPEPASPSVVAGLADFYGLNRVDDRAVLQDSFHSAIRADAHKRAEQGAAALAGRFETLVSRLRSTLDGLPMTRLVPVWRIEGGATHLSEYMLTRIVEVVVHVDDLAVSVGTEVDIPPDAAAEAFAVLLELARARSGDAAVLRAFARRERGDPEVLRVL